MSTVISFPSYIVEFRVHEPIAQNVHAGIAVEDLFQISFQAPISLKADDAVALDLRTGTPYHVRRGGIIIWRRDCLQ